MIELLEVYASYRPPISGYLFSGFIVNVNKTLIKYYFHDISFLL